MLLDSILARWLKPLFVGIYRRIIRNQGLGGAKTSSTSRIPIPPVLQQDSTQLGPRDRQGALHTKAVPLPPPATCEHFAWLFVNAVLTRVFPKGCTTGAHLFGEWTTLVLYATGSFCWTLPHFFRNRSVHTLAALAKPFMGTMCCVFHSLCSSDAWLRVFGRVRGG